MAHATEGTAGELTEEETRDTQAEGGGGARVVPLGSGAARRGVGSRAEPVGRVAVIGRRGQRGKNAFALPRGSRKRRYRAWRDDETRASHAPQNVLSRVLV